MGGSYYITNEQVDSWKLNRIGRKEHINGGIKGNEGRAWAESQAVRAERVCALWKDIFLERPWILQTGVYTEFLVRNCFPFWLNTKMSGWNNHIPLNNEPR